MVIVLANFLESSYKGREREGDGNRTPENYGSLGIFEKSKLNLAERVKT